MGSQFPYCPFLLSFRADSFFFKLSSASAEAILSIGPMHIPSVSKDQENLSELLQTIKELLIQYGINHWVAENVPQTRGNVFKVLWQGTCPKSEMWFLIPL